LQTTGERARLYSGGQSGGGGRRQAIGGAACFRRLMPLISVLSPHRDDAVFSLGLCLSIWSRPEVRLQVINFFTVSAYGPHAARVDPAGVSAERRKEDRAALAVISAGIKVEDCGLLDAPIRLGIAASTVCNPEMRVRLTDDQLCPIVKEIRGLPKESLLMAPLGLGNHVDHLAVRKATLFSAAAQRICFYEDLPYATWTARSDFEARIAETECELKCRLKPVVVRVCHAVWRKRRNVCRYRSQITRQEGKQIADWASLYGGGERIWISAMSGKWHTVLRDRAIAVKSSTRATREILGGS
jgi:LmbE family N-acetylglucosaminyl deacetylase